MKKMTTTALLALLTLNVTASDFRDATFQASSKVSEDIYEAGRSATDATMDVADVTADTLKAFISKNLASSYKASEKIAKHIVKVSEVSRPAFQFTADGLALAFEVSADGTKQTMKVSKKVYIFLEPSLEVTGEIISDLLELSFEGTSEATELISDLTEFLSEVLEKPLDLTEMSVEEIMKLLEKAFEVSTNVSEATLGAENLEKGVEYSGKGISLTSRGIGAAFYVVSQATTGLSHLFDFNRKEREQLERMIDRDDKEGLAGIKDLIRAEINKNVKHGPVLNEIVNNDLMDAYISLKLSVPNLDEKLEELQKLPRR